MARPLRSWNLNAARLGESVRFSPGSVRGRGHDRTSGGGVDVVRLRVGDGTVGLFAASDGDRPGVPHQTVAIDGPDGPQGLRRELEGRGFAVDHVRDHRDGAGDALCVDDPDGNHLEMSVDRG